MDCLGLKTWYNQPIWKTREIPLNQLSHIGIDGMSPVIRGLLTWLIPYQYHVNKEGCNLLKNHQSPYFQVQRPARARANQHSRGLERALSHLQGSRFAGLRVDWCSSRELLHKIDFTTVIGIISQLVGLKILWLHLQN